jgi:hypothetical protein
MTWKLLLLLIAALVLGGYYPDPQLMRLLPGGLH